VNAPVSALHPNHEALQHAIALAADSIAPTWPLDQMIAVNPYWGRIHQPFEEVAAAMSSIAGSPMTWPLEEYAAAWQRGEISAENLAEALGERDIDLTVEQLLDALNEPQPAPVLLPLISDILDRRRDLQQEPAWCDTITHQISQFCAAYFDRGQADWHPDQAGRLYASWRSALGSDHSVSLLMRAPHIPAQANVLAEDPEQQILDALGQLAVPESEWPLYLQSVLMRVSGWAAWCAYLRWQV
jgi:hypothetical protein